ncbi:MAG TPA: methyltransferase, partial [Thermoanaerobaculia bacterium]|nr:methyltransferase [Thermoanaerobaculia bacterium]
DNWEYFAAHPDLAEQFNRAMSNLSALAGPMIAFSYDFSPFKTLIDIGGGEGRLLAAILTTQPDLRGAVFDLPGVAEAAAEVLRGQGLEDRSEVLSGNAFEAIPGGYDAYVMRNVLHDWSDEKAVVLLANCRAAIPDHGKLLIFDAIMPAGNSPHPAKWLDLQMMVALGGRERSAEEFRQLLDRTGFELTQARPLPAVIGVVEAVPR